ncbi:MAG: trigger factor [Dehalococcoidales bacterium]|nr:trigger factor [Dehalococcoidales bacterium]
MKATKEKIENSQAFITVEAEPDEVEAGMKKAYQRVVKKANIPGFRKGKAPRDVVESFVGKEALLEEALEDIISDTLTKALKEENIEPFTQSAIEITQMEPVTFKAIVPLPPVIAPGDYKAIKVEPITSEFKDEHVDRVIEQLRHQNAVWEPVDRAIAMSDMVTMDIKSEAAGKPVINRDGWQYQLEEGSKFPLPGFAEQLVGLSRGEEKEFTLQMPTDYTNTELAGKDVSFRIKVVEVKQEKLPEVNEEFVKVVSPECENITVLRERIAKELKERAEERDRLDYEEKVIQAVVDVSKIEYPPVIVERETERLLEQQLQYLQMSGMNIEDYMKAMKKTPDDLRVELMPRAEKRVRQSLLLEKIAESENIEVTETEVDAEIETMVKRSHEQHAHEQHAHEHDAHEHEIAEMRASFNNSRDAIKDMIKVRKAAQRLIDIAKSSYTENKGEPEKKEG